MQEEKYQTIWDTIRDQVKQYDGVNAAQTDAFFSRLHLQAFAEGFIMLTADNDFIKKWVERQYSTLINQALVDLYHTEFIVNIEVDELGAAKALEQASASVAHQDASSAEPRRPEHPLAPIAAAEPSPATPAVSATPEPEPVETGDNSLQGGAFSKMTFENYIIGESNRMAYSMALAVAERPGREDLNPLFIYGKSGVGKTHLLVAIKNYLDRTTDTGGNPLLKTVYVDSTEFINDYADASADHSREKTSFRRFKERYEEADVLLIDDVQSFQGKKETLKIVFELFNKLTSQGKQVVMSADIAPKNIDIDERYQSRFNSGATFDIQAPEMETKLGIINSTIDDRLQASGENIDIPLEVRSYIAEISSSNIRELKSAVTVLFLHLMTEHKNTIDIAQAARILENHFSNDVKRLTIADIQKEVETFYKVSHAELVGKGRRHAIAYPRQVAMYLCRQMMEETFESIGKAFGGKDHSTVKYSVDLIAEKVREDKGTRDEIDIVIAQIRDR
ncbi:MAG: chromosomal replication initiator protein DnaA [Coriobacteriaceae bacterium]|nr:chromosomal replication initiator protein DnaA [Coriobacteriaceae bacterium]